MIAEGDAAPAFTLPNEWGTQVPLGALRGGPVILAFSSATMAPTIAADLALHRRALGEQGATALLVIRGNCVQATSIAEPHGKDVVILADARGTVHTLYGVPERAELAIFLLDPRGDVAVVWAQPDPKTCISRAIGALDLAR